MQKLITQSLLILFVTVAFSQEQKNDSTKVENLGEVLITATRTERQLSSLPLPAQIISKNELEAVNSIRLSDILNEQTGLVTVSDFGGGEGIQMQGLDSQYTLVLIDGVPLVGRSAGTLDINRITVGNIKQIEVVKGASSSLYGSEALGGVINIITENPKFGFKGDVNYRYGTNNSQDASANIGYKQDRFSVSAFINRNSTDGYDLIEDDGYNTVDPFSNYTFTSKLSYDFSDNTNLFISGRYFTENQKYAAPDEFTGAPEGLIGESDADEWNTHIKVNHKYDEKWSSYFEFYATRYKAKEYLMDSSDSLISEGDYNQLLIRPEIRATYNPNEKSSFIGGLGLNHETLKRTDFTTNPEFNSPYIYLQYDANPTERINVILGARYDLHSEYKSQFSPKVAARYEINDKLSVKGSVGYGFKAPDFRQLYFDFTNSTIGYTVLGYNQVESEIPNLIAEGATIRVPISDYQGELLPENSVSFNFGGIYKPISDVSIELNLFRNNIQDLIESQVIATRANGTNVFSYHNLSKVYTQGFEVNASWKPNNYLKFSGGYQLLYAYDKDAEQAFENGEVYARLTPTSPSFQLKKEDYFGLYNRSRHMLNAKVFYKVQKWKLNTNLRASYRSKYGLFDTNGNEYLDKYDDFVAGYTLLNWAVNKTIFNNYEVGFGIDNIFDFTDAENITNISGRLFYGRINIKF